MRIILLTAGILIFLDGLTYYLSLPGSSYRKWLSERRDRKWMRMWPPAQRALDSERARLLTGIVQSILGIFIILLALNIL